MAEDGWDHHFRVIDGFNTEQEARKHIEQQEDTKDRLHNKSLFIAKQITEEIIPLPQRTPKRKAA